MSSSPFLAGGGAIRSPSPRSSQFSSTSFSPPPISTISESNGSSSSCSSSSSSFAIITKKPRAPRKRMNQSYNEAAALLSFVFPTVFRAPPPHRRRSFSTFPEPPAELILISSFPSFVVAGDATLFLPPELPPPPPENPTRRQLSNSVHHSYQSSSSTSSGFIAEPFATTSSPASFLVDGDDQFDPESMLNEGDAEEDIDGIMGELAVSRSCINGGGGDVEKTSVGFGAELRRRALRRSEDVDDDSEWRRKPTLAVRELIPKLVSSSPEPETTTTTKLKQKGQNKPSSPVILSTKMEEKPLLGLKLNYEQVLREWAGRGSPFAGETDMNVLQVRMSEMELLPESGGGGGGGREASVKRYREKRSRRVSSGKIRYQVRKVSADKRPRVKGRFVKAEEASVAAAAPSRRG